MNGLFICIVIFIIFIPSIVCYHVGYVNGFKKCKEMDDYVIDKKIKELKNMSHMT